MMIYRIVILVFCVFVIGCGGPDEYSIVIHQYIESVDEQEYGPLRWDVETDVILKGPHCNRVIRRILQENVDPAEVENIIAFQMGEANRQKRNLDAKLFHINGALKTIKNK